jgi:phospholipid transport system transporter-binding protein
MFQPASTLTFNTAKTALEAGLRAIADGQASIDLAGVTAVDSAAVATLIAWQRAAREKGAALAFLNVPATLSSLLELYGVATLLRADSPHHH